MNKDIEQLKAQAQENKKWCILYCKDKNNHCKVAWRMKNNKKSWEVKQKWENGETMSYSFKKFRSINEKKKEVYNDTI